MNSYIIITNMVKISMNIILSYYNSNLFQKNRGLL